MPVDARILKALVDHELMGLSDTRVVAHIRGLLVEPSIVLRDWDYGKPGEQFPCWAVLNDFGSNTGIAYCEYGFGPRCPWGLVWLGSDDHRALSIGMDSGWFSTFLDAYFDSFAATDLPIWQVFRVDPAGTRVLLTGELSWEAAWQQVAHWRTADPTSRYDCSHSIAYRR
jgi:hypothetical protein